MSDKGTFVIKSLEDWNKISRRVEKHFRSPNAVTPLRVTVKRDYKQRSAEQNAYYWGVVLVEAVRYYKNNPADLIRDLMAAMKLDFTPEFAHELFKIMFNSGKSTAKNDVDEMVAYNDAIREHFYHNYTITIPEPKEG